MMHSYRRLSIILSSLPPPEVHDVAFIWHMPRKHYVVRRRHEHPRPWKVIYLTGDRSDTDIWSRDIRLPQEFVELLLIHAGAST